MKSYIKIYGPPLMKALRTLEKITEEISDDLISSYYHSYILPSGIRKEVPIITKLISKTGHTLGDHDFFFEWAKDPTWEELQNLILKIDEALGPLGCRYTIVTK